MGPLKRFVLLFVLLLAALAAASSSRSADDSKITSNMINLGLDTNCSAPAEACPESSTMLLQKGHFRRCIAIGCAPVAGASCDWQRAFESFVEEMRGAYHAGLMKQVQQVQHLVQLMKQLQHAKEVQQVQQQQHKQLEHALLLLLQKQEQQQQQQQPDERVVEVKRVEHRAFVLVMFVLVILGTSATMAKKLGETKRFIVAIQRNSGNQDNTNATVMARLDELTADVTNIMGNDPGLLDTLKAAIVGVVAKATAEIHHIRTVLQGCMVDINTQLARLTWDLAEVVTTVGQLGNGGGAETTMAELLQVREELGALRVAVASLTWDNPYLRTELHRMSSIEDNNGGVQEERESSGNGRRSRTGVLGSRLRREEKRAARFGTQAV